MLKNTKAINSKYINKQNTKRDARGALCCVDCADAGAALQAKRLIHEAACKHGQDGPPSLFFLSVGNNTDNTGAKDTSERRISEAFYTPNPTLALCESALWSGSAVVYAYGGGQGG